MKLVMFELLTQTTEANIALDGSELLQKSCMEWRQWGAWNNWKDWDNNSAVAWIEGGLLGESINLGSFFPRLLSTH